VLKLLSLASDGNKALQKPLTEKEKRLGLTEEHAYDLKEELDRAQEQFQKQIRPIWEQMKDGLRVQLVNGIDPEKLVVPYRDKYQAALKETLLAMAEKGAAQVQKELGRKVDMKAPEDWADEVSAALSQKDCMDLKYFVRLEYGK